MAIKIPSISPSILSAALPGASCGASVDQLFVLSQISSLVSTLGSLNKNSIGSLAGYLVNLGIATGLIDSRLIGLVSLTKRPTNFLQRDVGLLILALLTGGDAQGIASLISGRYRQFDLQAMLALLASGKFNLCKDVPNTVVLSDGDVITFSTPPVPSTLDSEAISSMPTFPSVEPPTQAFNSTKSSATDALSRLASAKVSSVRAEYLRDQKTQPDN